ncbi:MAG: phosphonate ABC transporter, permease protein PhnE [Deltaproteobacteria bacterium]|nr:phosphonate ABC transporter, permease protein PhnE [Deltaproteobacteria bacterium]
MDVDPNGKAVSMAHKSVTWSRYKYPQSLIRYGVYLFTVVFIGYSLHYLNIPIERFYTMFGLGGSILSRYYPPDIAYALDKDYLRYVFETVQMAYVGTLLGVVISIPIAWCASFNVTPSRWLVYPIARFIIMASRSVHEMIWAILFVIILGYGMLPGVLALTLFTIGFAGKLFSEEVEAIKMGPVEAIRATGGNSLQVMVYAVLPQVKVAWTGISIYTWDSSFRAATVLGYFGAGGMGWYLKQTIETLENLKVSAILLSIIMLVIVSEVTSAWARGA